MLRRPQYKTDQRIFMVNHRIRVDSIRAISYDFTKAIPLSGREPDRQAIERNKKKFNKEGKQTSINFINFENYYIFIVYYIFIKL